MQSCRSITATSAELPACLTQHSIQQCRVVQMTMWWLPLLLQVLHLLQAVCSAEDADVMHHLRPSTDTAACATVIRRWMQAANQAAAATAAPAK